MIGIVIISFLVDDQDRKCWFFKKTLVMVDISIDIIYRILIFILSNVKIDLNNWELKYRLYTIVKTLLSTKWIELIKQKEFAIIALNLDNKTFLIHILFFASFISINPSHRAQIVLLKTDKTFIAIISKYIDFINIFFLVLTIYLLKYIKINNYAIELIDGKLLLY